MTEKIEVFKTYLFFSDFDQGNYYLIDTIFYEGDWWLVGSWLQSQSGKSRVPQRLVRLTGLRFQEVNEPGHRFLLNNSIPKSVLDGSTDAGYVVRAGIVDIPVSGGIH